MKELSILFTDSLNKSLLNNFKDTEHINDYFEINKFKANKKEILSSPWKNAGNGFNLGEEEFSY